ncbi:S-layer homology domain-containing protein [Clostridiales bacterium COT073_COT-073]|nr:S-layer homology domain-containing protein [Clostridiales bacterium COT073_COT-073]
MQKKCFVQWKLLTGLMVMAFMLVLGGFSQVEAAIKWQGKEITLSELAAKLEYDLVDANGVYKPMYYEAAQQLWQKGILLGNDGSFDLDKPVSRIEGIVLITRILGKGIEAANFQGECRFTDVPQWGKNYVAYAAANQITAGYSETVFGAKDPMTANQYLTFVLRALGYDDKAGDFSWDKAADKALEIGLIGQSCQQQYMNSDLFLRDNVAAISFNALSGVKTKDGRSLSDNLPANSPKEKMPYPTLAAKLAAESVQVEPTPQPSVITADGNYPNFAVPQFEKIAPAAVKTVLKETEKALFLVYSTEADKAEEYIGLLQASGFSSQGKITIPAKSLFDVTGGLVTKATQDMVCPWYGSGNFQVLVGQSGNYCIVRVLNQEIDAFSADDLRKFFVMILSK